MTEKKDVLEYLWAIKDRNEIRELWDILKGRSKQLEEMQSHNFSVGMKVKFDSQKRGQTIEGTIVQVNKQSIIIQATEGKWRVSPSVVKTV
jgi:hypothetical protein